MQKSSLLTAMFSNESKGRVWFALWMMLVGLAWLQPDHFPPWLSFHSEVISFCSVAAGFFYILRKGVEPKSPITLGSPEIAMLSVGLVALIQYVVGAVHYAGDVVILWQYVVGLTFAIVTGRAISKEIGVLDCLAWVILMAALCSTAIALFQAIRPYDECALINLMPGWRRPGANMGQANHLGTLALWSVGSTIFLTARNKISLWGAFPLATLSLFGAGMSESRTALIGVGLIAIWFVQLPQAKGKSVRLTLASTLAITGTLLFLSWPRILAGIQEGSWEVSTSEVAAINTQGGARFVVWQQLLHAILLRPLSGWGFGGVSSALNAVADRYSETFPFTYSHNVILDLLVWFGIPLAVAFIALACIWSWRRCRRVHSLQQWYAVALLIPFLIHSLLEFPFAYGYFLFPAGIMIGVLDSGSSGQSFTLTRGVIVWALLGWLVMGVELIREYQLAEEDYRVARSEALRIGRIPSEYSRPALQVLTQLDALNTAIRISPSPGMEGREIEALRQAALRFPSISVQKRYATSLALNGEIDEARRQLQVISAMHGQRVYDAITAQWHELAQDRYPQLEAVFIQ